MKQPKHNPNYISKETPKLLEAIQIIRSGERTPEGWARITLLAKNTNDYRIGDLVSTFILTADPTIINWHIHDD